MPTFVCVCQWDPAWCPAWFNDLVGAAPHSIRTPRDFYRHELETARQVFWSELKNALNRSHFLSSLLIFIPLGFLSYLFGCPGWIVFLTNFFSVLPMAWLIGKATEDMASYTGEVLGGLLNATFGNIVEMLLCIAGIRQHEILLIQCTLVGSILSNMLLVMGTALIVGGFRHHRLFFSEVSSNLQGSLMLLSVLGVALPTLYCMLVPGSEAIQPISHVCSVLLFVMYLQYLVFQLWTHADFIEEEGKAVQAPLPELACRRKVSSDEKDEEEDDEDDEVDLSLKNSLFLLGICTVITAFCSDFLISSMTDFMVAWRVSREFIGIVILPIIGNAAEHWTAVLAAYHGKTDLALGVAIGSSCQMALFVTPFTVLVGWVVDSPMTLDFHPFQAMVLLLSVLIVSNILKENESNWLTGSMLCTAYAAIALIYFKSDPYTGGEVVEYG